MAFVTGLKPCFQAELWTPRKQTAPEAGNVFWESTLAMIGGDPSIDPVRLRP
jgi:hypothetical protein